jgi:hypothetical protein
MARTGKKPKTDGFVLFDVVYEDGSQSSNRKIAMADLADHDGDAAAKAILEAQDRTIAEASGRPRGPIKTIKRSAVRK